MKIDFNKELDWRDICTVPVQTEYTPMFSYNSEDLWKESEKAYRRMLWQKEEMSLTLKAWLKYDEEQFIKRISDRLFEEINKPTA